MSEKPTSKGKRKQTRVVVTGPEPKESDEDFAERFRRAVLGEDAPAPKPQRGRKAPLPMHTMGVGGGPGDPNPAYDIADPANGSRWAVE